MNDGSSFATVEKKSASIDSICARCLKILPDRLFAKGRSRRQKRFLIGRPVSRKSSSSCTFCIFLQQLEKLGMEATKRQDVSLTTGLRQPSFSTFDTQRPWWHVLGLETDRPLPTFAWYENVKDSTAPLAFEPKTVISWVPIQDEDARASVPRKRSPDEENTGLLDLRIAREWLDLCEADHAAICRFDKQLRLPLCIRLIDVHAREIVNADTGFRYVALSYVWGNSTKMRHGQTQETSPSSLSGLSEASLTRRLPENLPATLEDALTVSAKLGERYTWIDLLCIDQTNEDEIESQIQQMNVIYQSATFTIIARDSESAYTGIAGVSRSMKQRSQPICHLPGGELMATALHPAVANAGKAVWDTRAWTMQEYLFSFRILSFTTRNLRMVCRKEYFVETIVTETGPDRRPVRFINKDDWDDVVALDLRIDSWDFVTFSSLISLYTARLLKYPDDILNACQGALTELQTRTAVHFKYGLPVEDLHRALLWSPHRQHTFTRRHGFPSWSWCGWFGRIDYRQWILDLASIEHWQNKHDLNIIDRKHKRRKGSKPKQIANLASAEVARVTFLDQGLLRIKSQVASCTLQKRREDQKSSTLLTAYDSEVGTLVKKDLGFHWTILNPAGRPLMDHANNAEDPDVFDEANHFLRLSEEQSEALEAVDGQVDLALIHDLPLVRDSYEHDWYLADMVSCLVLVKNEDGQVWRIGALLLKKHVFESFKPKEKAIDIA